MITKKLIHCKDKQVSRFFGVPTRILNTKFICFGIIEIVSFAQFLLSFSIKMGFNHYYPQCLAKNK